MGFKDSTIKKVLHKKITDVGNSITEDRVRKIFFDNVIVSGGAITSMLLGEKVNDYDFYLKSFEAASELAKYYVGIGDDKGLCVLQREKVNITGAVEMRVVIYKKSAGVSGELGEETEVEEALNTPTNIDLEELEATIAINKPKLKYAPIFFSENAITLKGKAQIVTRFYGPPDVLHNNFDFVHTQCYYDFKTGELCLPHDALRSVLSKTLKYTGGLYPLASLFRTRKFIERGWRISAGEMLKAVFQLNGVDLKDIEILRDQLLGVDYVYMQSLMNELENYTGQVDATYLGQLIDRIFV